MELEYDAAYMEKYEFDKLLEYSTTLPTGTIVGKLWKRKQFSKRPRWWLGEYFELPKNHAHSKTDIGIKWREIFITGPMTP